MTSEDPLNILLIGSGGREHALAWKLSQSRRVHQIYVCGGMAMRSLIDTSINIKYLNRQRRHRGGNAQSIQPSRIQRD
jgi:phosphoribosylamine-glycine ligase